MVQTKINSGFFHSGLESLLQSCPPCWHTGEIPSLVKIIIKGMMISRRGLVQLQDLLIGSKMDQKKRRGSHEHIRKFSCLCFFTCSTKIFIIISAYLNNIEAEAIPLTCNWEQLCFQRDPDQICEI